jgi:hypothetical protein
MKYFAILASVCFAFSLDIDPKGSIYFTTRDGNVVSDPLTPCEDFDGKFDVESVVLTPYPIVSGAELQVAASGLLHQKVLEGAKVVISVKFGPFTLFSKTVDLCEEAAKNDVFCPIEVGQTILKAGQLVPSIAPAGSYNLEFRVKNPDGTNLACVAGKVAIIKKPK